MQRKITIHWLILNAGYKIRNKNINVLILRNLKYFFSTFVTNNDIISLPQSLNTKMLLHLYALENEFERYFLEHKDKLNLVQNPFRLPAEKTLDEYYDQFL